MLKILDHKNARYSNATADLIDLDILDEELGWIPITIDMSNDDKLPHIINIKNWLMTHRHSINVYTPPVIDLAATQRAWCARIDEAAGYARARFVSVGSLIDEEYKLTQSQCAAWREAGSPANNVPESVQTWADVNGWSAEQAAADIEAIAQAWNSALLTIRRLRLEGKAAVDATTSVLDAPIAANSFIELLNAIQPA